MSDSAWHRLDSAESAGSDRHSRAVAGLVAFSCTVASIRHAKDAGKAPSMGVRSHLLSVAAHRTRAFEQTCEICRCQGWEIEAVAGPYLGSLGDFDERLRPADWAERVLKTVLSLGLLSDFCRVFVQGLAPELSEPMGRVLAGQDADCNDAATLLPAIADDPQMAARLGLWGRRVVGEEIGTLLGMLGRYPDVLAGTVGREDVHAALSEGALTRMRALGLRV